MSVSKRVLMALAVGLVIGVVGMLGLRFVTYKPSRVHYHANFDVYINGQRETFKSPLYYEESGAGTCTAEGNDITPAERAHMHDNISDLVHIHDHAVTWGNFFQNLRWTVNDRIIQTPDAIYTADNTHHITFIIDGRAYQDVSNEVIRDQSRLLVDFGTTSDATIQKEFKAVPATAAKYDAGKDPASCQSGAAPTVSDRLHHLL